MTTNYDFSDQFVARLYDRASPAGKNHMAAFAFREDPARLDKFWKEKTKKYTDEQKQDFLKMIWLAADAQEKDRRARQTAGERLWRPKGVAVWFNAGAWANGVENSTDRQDDKPSGALICRLCDNPVKIKWTICKQCEKEYRKRDRQLHAENLEKMGIAVKGRTLEEINRDIKDSKAVTEYFKMMARVGKC